MTRADHIVVRAMEECNELGQRLSKALIFGMEQIQQDADDKPEQNPNRLTNRERVIEEYNDLVALMEMAGFPLHVINGRKLDAKKAKVGTYLERSRACGRLED